MQPKDSGKIIVTIFYPDATSGAHLVEAFHRSLKNLGEADALDPRPWRLDILEWQEMQAQATQDIACSDVVVIPADDTYASSAFFRRWVETWPNALDGRPLLLVPSRGVGDPWPSPQQLFVKWLQELAGRKGMEFADARVEDQPIHPWSGQEEKVTPPGGTFSPAHDDLHSVDDDLADWQSPPAPRFLGLNE